MAPQFIREEMWLYIPETELRRSFNMYIRLLGDVVMLFLSFFRVLKGMEPLSFQFCGN